MNVRDDAGAVPLHGAAQIGSTDLVELLLKNGATTDDKDDYEGTYNNRLLS